MAQALDWGLCPQFHDFWPFSLTSVAPPGAWISRCLISELLTMGYTSSGLTSTLFPLMRVYVFGLFSQEPWQRS